MVMSDRWRISPGLRRTSAFVAIVALAIGGAKIASDHTMPGSGFSTVATVAADPTGPTGGGMTGPPGGGSQFQPPGLPPQQPDYQGGNQPPLDQNNGVSIYNSGAPQAEQQAPGQQSGQQPQQAQQPAHGSQIPDYQTATPYTQGPGKLNPDYQAPQQNSPQQPQEGSQQQPQRGQQQQPNQQQQPQNKQDDTTRQLNDQQDNDNNDMMRQCQNAQSQLQLTEMGLQMVSGVASLVGGVIKPGKDPGIVQCAGCEQYFKQKDPGSDYFKDKTQCPAGYAFAGSVDLTQGQIGGLLFSVVDSTVFSYNCGKIVSQTHADPQSLKFDDKEPLRLRACPNSIATITDTIGKSETVTSQVAVGAEASGEASKDDVKGALKLSGSFTRSWSEQDLKQFAFTWNNPKDGFVYELVPLATKTVLDVVRMQTTMHEGAPLNPFDDDSTSTTQVVGPTPVTVLSPEKGVDFVRVMGADGQPEKAVCN